MDPIVYIDNLNDSNYYDDERERGGGGQERRSFSTTRIISEFIFMSQKLV